MIKRIELTFDSVKVFPNIHTGRIWRKIYKIADKKLL